MYDRSVSLLHFRLYKKKTPAAMNKYEYFMTWLWCLSPVTFCRREKRKRSDHSRKMVSKDIKIACHLSNMVSP